MRYPYKGANGKTYYKEYVKKGGKSTGRPRGTKKYKTKCKECIQQLDEEKCKVLHSILTTPDIYLTIEQIIAKKEIDVINNPENFNLD